MYAFGIMLWEMFSQEVRLEDTTQTLLEFALPTYLPTNLFTSLLTYLQVPLEGFSPAQIRSHILEGGRPPVDALLKVLLRSTASQ